MNDFVINVRQIMEYPLKGEASSADAVLLQTGALGGPYAYTTAYGLVVGALDWPGSQLGVGIPLPGNAVDTGVLATHLLTPLGCTIGWNWFATVSGRALLAPGNAAQLCYDGTFFSWGVSFDGDDFATVQTLDNTGYLIVGNTVLVSRDPEVALEVATKGYTDDEIQALYNTLINLYNTATVWSWNGRTGNVSLTLGDITGAGGAPISSPSFTGTPTAPTPPFSDASAALATTAFVQAVVGAAIDQALTEVVDSFNGRTGDVVLTLGDVTSVGGAPISSPAFSGTPTSTTPPLTDSSTRIATTAFVQQNLTILNNNIQSDLNYLENSLLNVINNLENSINIDLSRIVRIQARPPTPVRPGDLWWDSSKMESEGRGNLFIYYDDRTSAQWVVANSGPPGPPGPPGEATSYVNDDPPDNPAEGAFWTSPTGTFVWASGEWQRVAPTIGKVITDNYTLLPTDDWILFYYGSTKNLTLTLPPVTGTPTGHQIRVSVQDMIGASTMTIVSPNNLTVLTKSGWQLIAGGSYTIDSLASGFTGTELSFVNLGPAGGFGWMMVNEGPPIFGNPPLPGLSGVPGFIETGSNYSARVTDEWIRLSPVSGALTLTLPPNAPVGKEIRLIIDTFSNGASLMISAAFILVQDVIELDYSQQSLTIFGPPNGIDAYALRCVCTASNGTWFIYNEGPPLVAQKGDGTNRTYPGLMPGPPPGTLATAVLHADMTWY